MTRARNQNPELRPDREKRLVALSSVLAACLLTGMKIVVGLSTHSLGILSEAAHSGLDLVAAVLTLLAVKASARPADREHPYGHGKIENLSALVETGLLGITCVWIGYEAVHRLVFSHVEVDASLWAFLTVGVSIAVDFSRSRALSRVARKYQSRALEADALHFSTDIWSSLVVFFGLILVRVGEAAQVPWLVRADAAAALGVAGIVVWVSIRLGKKTVDDLLDAISPAVREQVERAAQVPGVVEVRKARIRRAGAEYFADLTLTANRDESFERAHDLATQAEAAIHQILPRADVTVHIDPVTTASAGFLSTVRHVAARHGLSAHGIRIHDLEGNTSVEMHLEAAGSLTVAQAHQQVCEFESDLRGALPALQEVITHIEPADEDSAICRDSGRIGRAEERRIVEEVQLLPSEMGLAFAPHEVTVRRTADKPHLSFHCVMDPKADLADAHALTEEMERRLRQRMPNLGRIVIRVEPPEHVAG